MGVRALLTAPSGQLEVVPARDTLSVFSGQSHISIEFTFQSAFELTAAWPPPLPQEGRSPSYPALLKLFKKPCRPWLQNLIEMST